MTISKHHNHEYLGGSPNLPKAAGDNYYSQDLGRDYHYLLDRLGLVLKDLTNVCPVLLSGGTVTQGAGATLNITAGYGYVKKSITVPTDNAIPPTTGSEDIDAVRVAWTQQTNMTPTGYTTGGATNYVKVQFAESDSLTRSRAHKAGSYYFAQTHSYTITVNTTPNTDYDLLLATFTESGGTFTITTTYHKSSLNIPLSLPIFLSASNMEILTAGTTWVKPEGITKVLAFIQGAGSGGAGSTGASNSGGGGGAGSLRINLFSYSSGISSKIYSIGAGGFGGSATNNGATGTSTTFDGVSASAGLGGLSNGNASGNNSIGAGEGFAAVTTTGGDGCGSLFGNGGSGGSSTTGGNASANSGGGGGGAGYSGASAFSGGNGGSGCIVLFYW